ncbi:MAG: AbrB/MazE/SpoVT family DNA-binding domain-containing protein [Gemmatimonadetes bacterium]|nr:AbrB/MazE/SpoVT family DNA-binding domain-containing protein [Gemmatimonadota bacterium]
MNMPAVVISPKFQIVIPKALRAKLGLKPGHKVEVVSFGDHLAIIPVRPTRSYRGRFPALDPDVPRDGWRPL